jgi:hypothetical protein
MQNIKTRKAKYSMGKMFLDIDIFRFPIVKWYEGTPNGVVKARPILGSSNDSSQNTHYKDNIGK